MVEEVVQGLVRSLPLKQLLVKPTAVTVLEAVKFEEMVVGTTRWAKQVPLYDSDQGVLLTSTGEVGASIKVVVVERKTLPSGSLHVRVALASSPLVPLGWATWAMPELAYNVGGGSTTTITTGSLSQLPRDCGGSATTTGSSVVTSMTSTGGSRMIATKTTRSTSGGSSTTITSSSSGRRLTSSSAAEGLTTWVRIAPTAHRTNGHFASATRNHTGGPRIEYFQKKPIVVDGGLPIQPMLKTGSNRSAGHVEFEGGIVLAHGGGDSEDRNAVEYTLGVGVTTGAGIRDDSASIKVLGCGVTVGRKMSLSIFDSEIGVDLGKVNKDRKDNREYFWWETPEGEASSSNAQLQNHSPLGARAEAPQAQATWIAKAEAMAADSEIDDQRITVATTTAVSPSSARTDGLTPERMSSAEGERAGESGKPSPSGKPSLLQSTQEALLEQGKSLADTTSRAGNYIAESSQSAQKALAQQTKSLAESSQRTQEALYEQAKVFAESSQGATNALVEQAKSIKLDQLNPLGGDLCGVRGRRGTEADQARANRDLSRAIQFGDTNGDTEPADDISFEQAKSRELIEQMLLDDDTTPLAQGSPAVGRIRKDRMELGV